MNEFSKGVFTVLLILIGVSIIHYVVTSSIIKKTASENYQIGYDVGYDVGQKWGMETKADTVYYFINNYYEHGGLVLKNANYVIIDGCTFGNVGDSPAIDLRDGANHVRISNNLVYGIDCVKYKTHEFDTTEVMQ